MEFRNCKGQFSPGALQRRLSLKAISKALTRSEESVQARAKVDKLKISKMR